MRFLGVDLAWKEHNPSGVVVLEGPRFPLRLVEGPGTLPTHAAVLEQRVMHAYTGPEPGSWRQGYILAPVLRLPADPRIVVS